MQEESTILTEIASPDVIMMEVLIYCAASIAILMLMSTFYQSLTGIRTLAVLLICGFTFVVGMLCLTQDFTCSRGTLTYFGLPYFLALMFYMFQMIGRVRAESKRHL